MTAEQVALWAGAIAAVCAAAAGAWQLVRAVVRVAGRVDEVVDDWRGQPARPGVPARPGAMERMERIEGQTERIPQLEERVARIEHELHPNAGSSLRDAVDRVDRRTARIADDPQQ